MRRGFVTTTVAIAILGLLAPPASAARARTKLVSRNSSGPMEDSYTEAGSRFISGNGRFVVFTWYPSGEPSQVYIRDRARNAARLVSKGSDGQPGDSDSQYPSISANGRFVAYSSEAGNLPHGTSSYDHVYVFDRRTGRNRLVSKTSQGEPADDESDYANISGNARFVAFQSNASNLPGANGLQQIYVHDRGSGRTRLVSKNTQGETAESSSELFGPSISNDGRYVVFDTAASNLPGGSGSYDQAYVHDRRTGRTRLISRNTQGDPADDHSDAAGISGNGRYVAFNSRADNLPGANQGTDVSLVYVRDLETGRTRLVSKTSGGDPADDYAYYGHPSSSGRYITFESNADNLPGDSFQVYLHDRRTDRTILVSRANNGDPAEGGGSYGSISLDGRFVAFYSSSDDLPGGGATDLALVYSRGPLHR
jgi:hypothetical protein